MNGGIAIEISTVNVCITLKKGGDHGNQNHHRRENGNVLCIF